MKRVAAPRWSAWALAALVAVACLVPRVAVAETSNDDEVNALIGDVFESEYAKKEYVDALEKLQLANDVCQKGSCSAKVRGKILVAVGTVLAGGLDQASDAQEVFKQALKEYPGVTLLKGTDTGKVKAAWDAARGKPTKSTGERKKYSGSGRAPAGWKSAEASFYYDQAKQAEGAKAWADCVGYASDSLAGEDRISTKYLRASCNERAGKLADALSDYKAVADQGGKSGARDTAKAANDKANDLATRIPKLVIHPDAQAESVEVTLDDEPVAADKLGNEMQMNPGAHHVVATGKKDGTDVAFEQDVTLDEGKTESVELKLLPKSSQIPDTAIIDCMKKAKGSRTELAKCIGGETSEKTPINVTIGTEVSGYHDTDHTDVVTPQVSATIESPTAGWSVNGSFLVDVVTTASTDIVATASPRWTEVRYAPALGGSKKFGDATLGAHASASFEPDYISGAGGLSFAIDTKQKTVTPQLGYDFSYDLAGRSGTPWSVYSHSIITNVITVGVALVLDKSTVLTLTTNAILENGDTSKPYRYVPIFKATDAPIVPPGLTIGAVNQYREPEKIIEKRPTSRQRFALAGRLAHRFTAVTFRADERLYLDTWGLKASTTDLTMPIDLGEQVRIWPHLRGHFQTGVSFWKIAYAATVTPQGVQVPTYRVGDRELGPLIGVTGGLGGRFALTESKSFALTAAGDVIYTRFLDDLYILQKTGFLGSLGAEIDFE